MKVIKQCPESVFITGEHIRVLQNIINPGLLAEIILFFVIKNRDFVLFIVMARKCGCEQAVSSQFSSWAILINAQSHKVL